MNNSTIYTKNIRDISSSINNLTKEIEMISRQKMLEDEKQWLMSLIEEFRVTLKLWITRHTDELIILEKEVADINTNIPHGKQALELTEKRLEMQIQQLMQIQ